MNDQFDNHFLSLLKQGLKSPLPGKEAQYHMAPFGREDEGAISVAREKARMSAVLILFYEHQTRLRLILIKRPNYRGVHGGQVSFPGGKIEDKDATLKETALRESEEEIGVNPEDVELLGSLTPLYIPPSNFWVYPFVGFCELLPNLTPCLTEVERILEADFEEILSPEVIKEGEVAASGNRTLVAPYFLINEHVVWGATAMILNELRTMMKGLYNNYQ